MKTRNKQDTSLSQGKQEHIDIIKKHINNSNFLNHHNYYKNTLLIKQYKFYKITILCKFIALNISIIICFIILWLLFYTVFIQIASALFVLTIVFSLLILKDIIFWNFKEKNITYLYLRLVKPRYFQKIKSKVFFY